LTPSHFFEKKIFSQNILKGFSIKICFFIKALPDPDLRYFSKSKAVYLLEKAKYEMRVTGRSDFVAGTDPLLCLSILSLRLSVQPVYGLPLLHLRI